ncbi:hypothetical protein ABPG75_014053 [Micractinium tetrahymenae]
MKIREVLNAVKVPAAPEPKRGKTHWDCLLEEMAWLAKEFAKERAWKAKQAKRAAVAVQRSNLDLESRVLVRQREAEKSIRKRAAWIAKEVMAFWDKAQRVVLYKVKSQVEAKKKEVMDRQLDFLLGQTQKYSTMLAERLKGEQEAAAAAAAATAARGGGSSGPDVKPEPSSSAGGEEEGEQEEGAAEAAAAPPPRRQQRRAALRGASPALPASAAVSGTADRGDDSADYRSGEDDDADNEATIEEEEALAAAEGRDVKREEVDELAGLDEEADLPLEELLARYGNYHLAAEAQESAGSGEEEGEDEDEEEGNPAGAAAAPVKLEEAAEEEEGTAALLEEAEEDADGEGTAALLEEGEEPPAAAAAADGAGPSQPPASAAAEEGDEDEYRAEGEDDADNEATIEEEEALAAAEGRDVKREEVDELAGLDEEAELPLEELLARYGNYHLAAHGGQERAEDEEMPDAAPAPAPGVKIKREDGGELEPPPPAPARADVAADGGTRRCGGSVGAAGEEADGEAEIKGENERERMGNALAQMAELQPMGTTLDTAQIQTKTPFLIKGVLREYQQIGLDWLVTLYHKRLNGILADEMGLGKTIQTIALLAHLACEKGDWGPHLVVVPTSVMLNWEMEFKKWCPAFKLLTYFGSVKERAAKRQGWSKANAFHVCITSYTLVLQDARMFKRKKWKYLILDEAHMIKNWKSQRWQTLLNFNSKRRLLITGTPLQNDLMELWSLMHFLMPQVFASHAQFKDWFSNPLTGMVEGSAEMNRAIVERLHAVLRPFLLRRLKKDVEKQLPQKHEHVVYCRLSKRQRKLYEEYMASGNTRATLASGNFLGIMNCLMQLRKVCNHPDLFEGRPIVSAFDMQPLELRLPNAVPWLLERRAPFDCVSLDRFLVQPEGMAAWEVQAVQQLALAVAAFAAPATRPEEDVELLLGAAAGGGGSLLSALPFRPAPAAVQAVVASVQALARRRRQWRAERTALLGALSSARTAQQVAVGAELARLLRVELPADSVHVASRQPGRFSGIPNMLCDIVRLPEQRAGEMDELLRTFCCAIPKARAPPVELICSHPDASLVNAAAQRAQQLSQAYYDRAGLLHTPRIRTQLFFPDRRLIQFDCGKLQELATLLARLKAGGHKCLIFTQMSKMLDVLEAFLNLHAYTYVRLDGATKPEQRQIMMQRFNTDPKIFCFILSTRSGGVGMNLIGADTVIFYDSDWNPAMDAQAQDRCHRIGQTREVHIYRLISEHTIEENILKKSDQKRQLDWLAIQSGGFTTDILTKIDPSALMAGFGGGGGGMSAEDIKAAMRAAEDEGDVAAAAAAEREVAAEMDEFTKEPGPGQSEAAEAGDDTTTRDSAGGGAVAGAPAGAAATSAEHPAAGAAGGGEDDQLMKDVAALAGGAEGGDAIAQLEAALRPVERYAVRFVEREAPSVDKERLEAEVEQAYRVEEFDMQRMEEAEEEREAEIDEDEEANVVADWDQGNALEAYHRQLERAQEAERRREEAERKRWEKWYIDLGLDPETAAKAAAGDVVAQSAAIPFIAAREAAEAEARGRALQATLAAVAAAAPSVHDSGAGRGGGRTTRGGRGGRGGRASGASAGAAGWGDVADTAGSARGAEGPASKRQRVLLPLRPFPQPWEVQEDFVLCSVAAAFLEQGQLLGDAAFSAAADALAAGAAATTVAGADAAAAQGKKRSAAACRQRYTQLAAAAAAAGAVPAASGKENLNALLSSLWAQLQRQLAAGGTGPKALAVVQAVLAREVAAGAGRTQQAALAAQLQVLLPGAPALPAHLSPPLATTLPAAQALAAAVRQRCGGGDARVITSRLEVILDAARTGGAQAARQAAVDSFSRPAATGGLGSPRSIAAQFATQQQQQHPQQPWLAQQPMAGVAPQPLPLQQQQAWMSGGGMAGMPALPASTLPMGAAAAAPAAAALPVAALAAFGLAHNPGLPPLGFPPPQQ